ncbi:helix-turn-helix transcriptional regulator [Oscillatoria sp. CS-180]|uniref:helix-turn-helix transcriptional regulator n=1 Tax=Oscillatoria sp. CS-180 TaxID=3021720 RepID=UPI00232B1C2F|nr:LuxR family transcriptional regulator [Oscillatoria sp. CS-180]
MSSKSLLTSPVQSRSLTQSQILQMEGLSLENHIGSVLIITEEGDVIYATESLRDQLEKLAEDTVDSSSMPQEISLIFQVLQQCRNQFPNQNWAIEFDIFTKGAIALRIRSRWLKLEGFDKPCLSIVLEDRQHMVQDIILDEVQDWGLTPREREVWLLYQDGCTYSQIAKKLYITINTVKKHMRSVHAKRRTQSNDFG